MNNRQKRKNIMKYLVGVLSLLASVFLAWILPEFYGNWKDERLIGTVQLSEREKIDFLDGKSLEAQDRWQILAEIDSGKRSMSAAIMDSAQAEAMAFENSAALWEKGIEIIRRYAMADLLPVAWQEEYRDMITVDWMAAKAVQFEDIGFPVVYMHFYLLTEKGELSLTLLMDLELQLPYYVSATGAEVADGMARELGYTSAENMIDCLMRGGKQPDAEKSVKEIDFTAAFEMDSVQLRQKNAGSLECEADAILKGTTIPIYRNVVERAYYGEGIAVCCGIEEWVDIQRHFAVTEESLNSDQQTGLSYAGNEMEYLIDTKVWKQRMGGVLE